MFLFSQLVGHIDDGAVGILIWFLIFCSCSCSFLFLLQSASSVCLSCFVLVCLGIQSHTWSRSSSVFRIQESFGRVFGGRSPPRDHIVASWCPQKVRWLVLVEARPERMLWMKEPPEGTPIFSVNSECAALTWPNAREAPLKGVEVLLKCNILYIIFLWEDRLQQSFMGLQWSNEDTKWTKKQRLYLQVRQHYLPWRLFLQQCLRVRETRGGFNLQVFATKIVWLTEVQTWRTTMALKIDVASQGWHIDLFWLHPEVHGQKVCNGCDALHAASTIHNSSIRGLGDPPHSFKTR